MNKPAKIKFIIDTLESIYPNVDTPLNHTSPYTLLIAVMLSAQCTDKRVNLITPTLFALADTPAKMLVLGRDKIAEIIRPCGLFAAKSKAIIGASQILLEDFNGEVPQTIEELSRLPGVGRKTALVVVSQAFKQPAFAVDTHIIRLAARWGFSGSKNALLVERAMCKAFPKDKWSKLHLQMIFFGREYCPARGHVIEVCPICKVISN